jgi:hypothetical protein
MDEAVPFFAEAEDAEREVTALLSIVKTSPLL